MLRGSGVLTHISSLPSKFGIGTFGKEARKFVNYLQLMGQKYWQILPINPTSFGDSPYQATSTYALSPYFIDLELLVKQKYLTKEEINEVIKKPKNDFVDYETIYKTRNLVLFIAYQRAFKLEHNKILKFYKQQKKWLRNHALFQVIKELHNAEAWLNWEPVYRDYHKKTLLEVEAKHYQQFFFHVTVQYLAFSQYKKLKKYANNHGVKIIGDMPIYVALDSSDVWANRKQFLFNNRSKKPTFVAGVPPDYFSKTGQLWGNPIYDYRKMEKNNYKWWGSRVKHLGKLFDIMRIDHFRGFSSYYAIPFGKETAIEGKWCDGPGIKLINEIKKASPKLEIIAEDLGLIDEKVEELLKESGFPGIKVFQFAFDSNDKDDTFLPHMYEKNSVAYLGTHDNDVMTSFLKKEEYKVKVMDYLKVTKEEDIVDEAIASVLNSKAAICIFQIQDLLKLGGESRMNCPGTCEANWIFRLKKEELSKERAVFIFQKTCLSKRY